VSPDVRAAFVDHDNALLLRHLEDFHRIWGGHQTRSTRRKTPTIGIVERPGSFSFRRESPSPGLVRDFFRLRNRGVVLILRRGPIPFVGLDTAKIRRSIFKLR